MFWSFGAINWFCELGQSVTNQFSIFEEKFTALDWHLYPVKFQRMHLILLGNVQQPVHVRGYGNSVFIRESIKKVIAIHPSANQIALVLIFLAIFYSIDNSSQFLLFYDASSLRLNLANDFRRTSSIGSKQ